MVKTNVDIKRRLLLFLQQSGGPVSMQQVESETGIPYSKAYYVTINHLIDPGYVLVERKKKEDGGSFKSYSLTDDPGLLREIEDFLASVQREEEEERAKAEAIKKSQSKPQVELAEGVSKQLGSLDERLGRIEGLLQDLVESANASSQALGAIGAGLSSIEGLLGRLVSQRQEG